MTRITAIRGREVLDSRGDPTVEVDVYLDCGVMGRAAVPTGAPAGENEAAKLRDGDTKRYGGKGLSRAVENINGMLAEELLGTDAVEQRAIDRLMRALGRTEDGASLGANAILGVSLAVAKAAALALDLPLYKYIGGVNAHTLPVPMMNVFSGGEGPDSKAEFREFMVVPVGAESFKEALRTGVEVVHAARDVLAKQGLSTTVGDDGGFAPDLGPAAEVVETLLKAVKAAGYRAGKEVWIAIDAGSSAFYKNRKYILKTEENPRKSADEMVEFWAGWAAKYPIISIEDAMARSDWTGWRRLTDRLGDSIQLVGDELFETSAERLGQGLGKGAANAVLVKPSQVSTLSEMLEVMQMAQCAGFSTVVSHCGGETEDTTIADIAVAAKAGQIKAGSASRSDRMAKYNQLLRIEEELGEDAEYLGMKAFRSAG